MPIKYTYYYRRSGASERLPTAIKGDFERDDMSLDEITALAEDIVDTTHQLANMLVPEAHRKTVKMYAAGAPRESVSTVFGDGYAMTGGAASAYRLAKERVVEAGAGYLVDILSTDATGCVAAEKLRFAKYRAFLSARTESRIVAFMAGREIVDGMSWKKLAAMYPEYAELIEDTHARKKRARR